MSGPDQFAVERYLAVLRKLRDARGDAAERLFRRAEAMFFVMDGATAAAAVRAVRAEGLDL